MVKKIWKAFNLFVDKRDKRVFHLEPKEGGHKRLAVIQAELFSPIHPETASVLQLQLFRRLDFKKAGLEVDKGKVTETSIATTQNAIVEGTEPSVVLQRRQWLKSVGLKTFRGQFRTF